MDFNYYHLEISFLIVCHLVVSWVKFLCHKAIVYINYFGHIKQHSDYIYYIQSKNEKVPFRKIFLAENVTFFSVNTKFNMLALKVIKVSANTYVAHFDCIV